MSIFVRFLTKGWFSSRFGPIYGELRQKYERDLEEFNKKNNQVLQAHKRQESEEMAIKSFTDGTSILSGNNNNIDGEQSSTQNKRKKSVRF